MERGSIGRYSVSTVSGEAVRAFVPTDLPPVPDLQWSGPRQRLLERATLAVGRLDSVSALLPDPHLFLYSYVRREAVLSSQIEGTQSSLPDLLLFELDEPPGVPRDDVIEVSNYVAALEHGLARLDAGFPLSNRLLREMHALLLARGRGAAGSQAGEFRRSQNWIGGTRPGNAVFVPPPPSEVENCMAALERFIHAEEPLPALVRAGLVHVQLETIHPFLDGNGRIGRLLIALMLHADGLLQDPLLYLSLYLKQHRSEYYRLLTAVRTEGNWEAWLDFFLEGVEVTADGALNTAQRLQAVTQGDLQRVQSSGRTSAAGGQAFAALLERPVLSIQEVVRRRGISFPTASKGVRLLADLGIVREVTGRRRDRVFSYHRYLTILNEGGEPLAPVARP